jgi:23S rRNA G2445 N2-methylase RlmL
MNSATDKSSSARNSLATAHTGILATPPGFSKQAFAEVQQILSTLETARKFPISAETQGNDVIVSNASFDNLIEITCRSRLLSDVRLRLLKKRCHGWTSFSKEMETFPWKKWFKNGSRVAFRTAASGSEIENASKMRDLARAALTAQGFVSDDENPALKIDLSIKKNSLSIDVSLAGAPMAHRGWRAGTATLAPLREDLAAAVIVATQETLTEMNAPPIDLVLVPFAGSGTLGVETLLHAASISPLLLPREFGFRSFLGYRETMENWLRKRLISRVTNSLPRLHYIENHEKQFKELTANINRVQLLFSEIKSDLNIESQCSLADFFDENLQIETNASPGKPPIKHLFIPLNPPWGVRMTNKMTSANAFYERIGKRLTELSRTWEQRKIFVSGCILCPDEETWNAFKKYLRNLRCRTVHFTQGGRDIRLCLFHSEKIPHGN